MVMDGMKVDNINDDDGIDLMVLIQTRYRLNDIYDSDHHIRLFIDSSNKRAMAAQFWANRHSSHGKKKNLNEAPLAWGNIPLKEDSFVMNRKLKVSLKVGMKY